jgi:hypothetical protein
MLAILPFTKDKNNQMFVNTKVASFLRHLSIRYHNVNSLKLQIVITLQIRIQTYIAERYYKVSVEIPLNFDPL